MCGHRFNVEGLDPDDGNYEDSLDRTTKEDSRILSIHRSGKSISINNADLPKS